MLFVGLLTTNIFPSQNVIHKVTGYIHNKPNKLKKF